MRRQEELSIFGDTVDGVENPQVGHTHPYPTRYHGAIFTQPQASYPYMPAPYAKAPYSGTGADIVLPNTTITGTAPSGTLSADELATARKIGTAYGVLGTISAAICAYHGYKRDQSVGWAIGWAIFGSFVPVIAPAIAVAQGFGKPKAEAAKGTK